MELVIAVILFAGLMRPLASYEYDYHQMEMFSEKGTISDKGCYMPADSGYDGIFTYKPFFDLKRGLYEITVNYETTGKDNICYVTSQSDVRYNGMLGNDIILAPEVNTVTFSVWLNQDVGNVQVVTKYTDGDLYVKSARINQTKGMWIRDLLVGLGIMILINLLIFLKEIDFFKNRQKVNLVSAFIIMTIIACYPLMKTGIIRGCDLVFHLLRIDGIKDGIYNGMFPVKVQPNWLYGYGYAVSVFYGDLFLHIPAFLRMAGFSVQSAYKIFLVIVNIATVLFGYYSFNKIFKNQNKSLFATALYVLSPFRIYGMYWDSRLGESIAMVFIPMIFAGIYVILVKDTADKDYSRSYIWPMLGYVFLLNSHVLTTEIVAAFTIFACIICVKRVLVLKRFWELVKTAAGALILTVAYWVPFLHWYFTCDFTVNTSMDQDMIQQTGFELYQYFQMFGGSGLENCAPEYMETPGISIMLLIMVFVYALVNRKLVKNRYMHIVAIIGGVALFMTSRMCPWDLLHAILKENGSIVWALQRTSRIIPIVLICFAVAGTDALWCLIPDKKTEDNGMLVKGIFVTTAILTVITALYAGNFMLGNKPTEAILDLNKFVMKSTWSRGEYLRDYTDTSYLTAIGIRTTDEIKIGDYRKEGLNIDIGLENTGDNDTYVDLPLVSYPIYKASDDSGVELRLEKGDNNVVQLIVPADFNGTAHIRYKEPILWRIAELISLVSAIGFATICMKKTNKR